VSFEENLFRFMSASHPEVLKSIAEHKDIDDETDAALKKALEEFKATFA